MINSWLDFLDDINSQLYKARCEMSGESPDTARIEFDASYFDGHAPMIQLTQELDSDGESNYIYFMPIVSFPELDSTEFSYADSIGYYLDLWTETVGYASKVLINTPYCNDDDYR